MATDVQILTVVRACLVAQLPESWGVVQNFQPTGQARHDAATVYFTKLGDRPLGSPGRRDVWNAEREDFDHLHEQQMEATVRVQGFANEDDPDVTLLAADVAAQAALALQTDVAIAQFRAIGAQPLRIVALPAVAVQDERDAWEKVSTFDFVLSYSRAMVARTPSASIGDLSIHAV